MKREYAVIWEHQVKIPSRFFNIRHVFKSFVEHNIYIYIYIYIYINILHKFIQIIQFKWTSVFRVFVYCVTS